MKILEMRPRSYDKQMDKISKGRVRAAKEAVAGEIPKGSRVLEIGCGTGELAGMLAERGCIVEGFDLSPSMVATAEERIETENLKSKFKVSRMGVEGMDGLPAQSYDAVVSVLVFSELTEGERLFALKQAFRVLKPGGLLVIADEVVPRARGRRLRQALVRAPMLALTYLISGASPRPLSDLPGKTAATGFTLVRELRSQGDAFVRLTASRPAGKGDG